MKRQHHLRKVKFSIKHGMTARGADRRRFAPQANHSGHAAGRPPEVNAAEHIAALHDLTVSLRRLLGLPLGSH
jgi:hypothetical protein